MCFIHCGFQYQPGPDYSPAISREILEFIYDKCLRLAVQEVIPEQLTHWPVSYHAAMLQMRGAQGQLHFQSVDIPQDVLQDFALAFCGQLNECAALRQSFFVHELRGTKGSTTHTPMLHSDRRNQLKHLMEFMDIDAVDTSWLLVDVDMEVDVPGHVTHWATSGIRAMVEKVLPNAQSHQITALLRSQKHHISLAASLKDIRGFRTVTGSKGHADGVSYINVYFTKKTAIYQLFDGGLFWRHTAQELLPGNLSKLMFEVERWVKFFQPVSETMG